MALHASLVRVSGDFTLWVLAMDTEAATVLESLALPGLNVVRLHELEEYDPQLKAVEPTRTRIEYYFTCSPCLPRFLISRHGLDTITYLDSDLAFFSSPEPLFEELGDGSVAIVAHRFAPAAERSHARYGRYNVGWLTFRSDANGLACLDWWRERCLEWCHDRVDGDRYADQKYLEQFEHRFAGVRPLSHPGANLAPWNIARYSIQHSQDGVQVDGMPLVFFHFQGLRRVSRATWDSNLTGYGARLSPVLRADVFRPYIADLCAAEAVVARMLPAVGSPSLRRADLSRIRLVTSRAWRIFRAWLVDNLISQ